jgi:DNA-binding transcriptional ArsR family regulator
MPNRKPLELIHPIVSPRFEIFYALQALEKGAGDRFDSWRREAERRLTARARTSLANVAPTPLIWPLLADALRELPPAPAFPEIVSALQRMDDTAFQRFVLGGVFRGDRSVDLLVSRKSTLEEVVAAESKTQERVLAFLGLFPFDPENPCAKAFGRIVREPRSYREEVVAVLDSFWASGFSETWKRLEPEMRDSGKQIRAEVTQKGFAALARERNLPITIESQAVVTSRGRPLSSIASTAGIYLLPSAFNMSGLWASYDDARGKKRYFIPVLDRTLSPEASSAIDPSLIFRALGDTTRYAIATSIARAPMTSLELARAFDVSKPTITHHVQLMRAAGLIDEAQTERGVELSLNRRALERLSSTVSREMFNAVETRPVIRRSRRPAR